MKKVPFKKIVAFVVVGLLLFISNGYAQIEKGVTSTGKEVDCSTINPSVDKTVSEHGKIVTHPRVTRNGKLITTECSTCGVELSITDTVTCVSVTLNATVTAGDPTSAVLKVYSDAAHTSQVGSDIPATIAGGEITAVASNLNCHTRYYFVLEATDAAGTCSFDWTDSTRDMTIEKVTTCTVASVRALTGGSDLSHEHLAEGTTDQIDSVYDHEGNAYSVVQIGEQCWLRQNMRATTSPSTGHYLGVTNAVYSPASKCVYWLANDSTTYNGIGALYNWCATMDTCYAGSPEIANAQIPNVTVSSLDNLSIQEPRRGICPQGWHVPTDAEWITMESVAGIQNTGNFGYGNVRKGVNNILATCYWEIPGGNDDLNSSGLSILPAGCCVANAEETTYGFSGISSDPQNILARYWTATQYGVNHGWAYDRWMNKEEDNSVHEANGKNYGFSVRCVRDAEYAISAVVDSVSCNEMFVAAKVFGLGTLTGKTVCAYKNADYSDASPVCAATADMRVSNDSIYATIKNLDCHTRYYVKVTATDGTHPVEGTTTDSTRDMTPIAPTFCLVNNATLNENEFETGKIDSVRDHEGNAYAVVQIGEQCWLRQNMRATTTPSGKTLALADKDHSYTSSASSVPTYFINNTTSGHPDFYNIYGCLYNWVAAMDTTAEGNNHLLSAQYPYRGICPEGWHIPADDEFATMANYAVSANHYGESLTPNPAFGTSTGGYEGTNTHISNMLGTDCWQASTNNRAVGKRDEFQNATSFSALPAGFWYNGSFKNMLQYSYFWASTEYNSTIAYRRYLGYNNAGFAKYRDYEKYNLALSVRCVRDVQLDLGNITLDTVACTFIDVKAPLLSAKTSELSYDVQAYTDATYTTVAGASQVTINATKDTIFAHISNLEGNTHYYIRATAKEGALEDTSYFVESTHCMCKVYRPLVQEDPVNFRNYEWGHEANGIVYVDSVADHEGNRYSVCEVGPQCWIRENVRVTTSPSTGESILATSATNCDRMPQARWQTWIADSATRVLVGPVYNWPAMVDYGVTSGNPDVPEWYNNRKGLCPAGWHLQHSDEFDKVLVPNLGGNSEVVVRLCGGPVGSHSGDTDADGYLWKEYTGVNDLHAGAVNNPMRNSSALTFLACGQWCSDQGFNHRHAYHFSSANQTAASTFKYYWIQPTNTTIETGDDAKSHSHSMRCIRDGEITFSELVIDTISCTTAKFHAKYNNGVLDAVDVSKIKAGASTSAEFIQNNKAASVRVSNDTIYAEITSLDCSKDYTTFYIKVFDMEYESYVAKATIDRDPKSSTARPCTVTSVNANETSSVVNQIDSVRDHENNTYAVVQIGGLCWMKENMRAQSSPSGKEITKGVNTSADDVQHYYISTNVNSEEENYAEFGCLYNWSALMDTTSGKVLYNISDVRRGICPEGWHVPMESEWLNLEKQIANTTLVASDSTRTSYSTKFDAGRLAAGCNWGTVKTALTDPACYNFPERNSTLFSALPGGSKTSSSFTGVNANTIFWSAAEKDNDEAYIRQLASGTNGVGRSSMSKYQNAAYVRCVRDIEPEFTNLETTEVTCSSVHFTAKMSQGLVGYNANVVVSTQSDFSDTVTAQSLIIPADSIVIADFYDLKTNTQYFIKVDNDATDFTTELCACTVSSIDAENEHATDGKVYEVKDVDGNWYGVIQIGNQCWTRQNMRCTTSPSTGTSIVANNYYSTISRSAKWYGNDSTQYASYGLLYNACAALDMTRQTTDPEVASANSTTGWAYTAPDGFVQGICPAGWHVPSDAEWTTMENYVVTDNHYGVSLTASPVFGTQSHTAFPTDYAREGTNTPVSPMLAYPMTWTSDNTSNATASAYVYRDTTQFDAKAAGYFPNSNTAAGIGTYAAFWTATPNANNMFIRQMRNSTAGISRLNVAKYYDISVRCVRDVFHPEMSICEDTTFGTVMLKEVKDVAKVEFIKDGTVKKTIVNPASNVSVNDLPEGIYQVNAISPHRDTIVDNARVKHTYTHCTVGNLLTNEMGATTTQLDSVRDLQNNWYEVVQIGNQCWLKENMRTSQTNTGTDLTNKTGTTNKSTTDKYYYVPNQADRYGYLYNYPAANSICPSGWHLPTDDEWKTMVEAAGVTDDNTTTGTGLGKLVTSCDWPSLTGDASDPRPGNYEYAERNLSGFSALPAGEWNDDFFADGTAAEFWTATKSSTNAWYRGMGNTDKGTHRYAYQLFRAYSVRCVRDAQTLPTTCSVSSVRSADGSSDLSQEHAFRGSTTEIDSVSDHEGNSYAVVTINGLCVTKQNLRVNSSPTGKVIGTGTGLATEVARMNVKTVFGAEGYMYNWCAAVDTAGPVTSLVEPRRGLCPKGWHIPSATEIATLESGYDAGNFAAPNDSFVGTNWNTSATANAPGNATDPDKNSSGFSAIPTGYIGNTSDMNLGDGTSFTMWSSAINDISSAQALRIVNDMGSFTHLTPPNKGYGHPVRCVRDNE